MGSQISTPCAAKAISKLSVAEHMANIKPPPITYRLILSATAPFCSDTLAYPNLAARSSDIRLLFIYHGAALYVP